MITGKREDNTGLISALVYTAISLASALAFMLAAVNPEKYDAVARYGGAAWVFLLSMIITMPLVTSYFKGGSSHGGHWEGREGEKGGEIHG